MFGKNKDKTVKREAVGETAVKHGKSVNEKLHPIEHICNFVMKQKNVLQDEEIKTSDDLSAIRSSFDTVRRQSNDIRESVDQFSAQFSKVTEITKQFDEIITKMKDTADDTHDHMAEVRESSGTVETTINDVQTVFEKFQKSFDEIQTKVDEINGIANQTNLLALNASIEAARAGESGRGFAVVADRVNELSSDIKELVGSIGKSMKELKENNTQLISSIDTTHDAIKQSMTHVAETEGIVNNIKTVADEIGEGSKQMNDVFSECDAETEQILRTVNDSEKYYETVDGNIREMTTNITRKGFVFEDITNMLEQVPPVLEDIRKENGI